MKNQVVINILLLIFFFHTNIAGFNIDSDNDFPTLEQAYPKVYKNKDIIKLPSKEELWREFDFNFATNFGASFIEKLYDGDKNMQEILDCINEVILKQTNHMLRGETPHYLINFMLLNSSKRIFSAVFKNYPQLVSKFINQAKEIELEFII